MPAREVELNSHLAACKRLYDDVRKVFPSTIRPDMDLVANQDRRAALTTVHHLLLSVRLVEKLLKDVALEGAPQDADRELLRFYKDHLIADLSELHKLQWELMGLPNVDIDFNQVPPLRDSAPIWNIFVSGLDYWKLDDSGEFSEEELESAEQFLYSSFFEPDEWMQNNSELQPIVGHSASQRIPSNIRIRLREIYRSFTLGNCLAAIALSRAVLEYAIVDRAQRLNLNPYSRDPAHPKRIRNLGALVVDASEKVPQLKFDMETILEAGNRTIHPTRQDRLVRDPTALRDLALSVIKATRTVVESLYLDAK